MATHLDVAKGNTKIPNQDLVAPVPCRIIQNNACDKKVPYHNVKNSQ